MLEIEAKFALHDRPHLLARLREWGCPADPVRVDEDHYFNAPDRDFAKTDEAFRLRRIGESNFLTYKGPKRDLLIKTRTEIEIPIADGEAIAQSMRSMMQALGYRAVAIVRKERQIYHLHCAGYAIELSLDSVMEVGDFIEIEILANEDQVEAARSTILQIAAELGLHESERRSYLEMLLNRRGLS